MSRAAEADSGGGVGFSAGLPIVNVRVVVAPGRMSFGLNAAATVGGASTSIEVDPVAGVDP
jgi:hypothetical protein